jgi:hypothetical protein
MSSIIECVAALQANSSEAPSSNPPAALYFVIALAALVLGLIVLVFIRANPRR